MRKIKKAVLHVTAATVAASLLNPVAAAGAESATDNPVQLYGLIGSYVGSMKRSDSVPRTTVVGSGGFTTSYIGFRGREDLGDGLSAIFQLESFFQPDTGGAGRNSSDPTGFSRSGWAGLKGPYGQLTMGRHTSQYYLAMIAVNPFQSSVVFSPLVVQSYVAAFGNTVIGDTVWSNAVQYVSPEMAGLTVTAVRAPGEVAGDNAVANTALNLRYSRGPLLAQLSVQRVRTAAAAPSTAQTALLGGFSYQTSAATLYASASGTDNTVTEMRSRTYQLGTAVPVTAAGSVLFSWARTGVSNPREATPEHNTAALGYDHVLSKRTNVYAVWLYDHVDTRAAGNSLILGIRHLF
jgi:predicted porin